MAKDPAFLFYSQDFYTGTATLSFEDKGKYIILLCLMHQQGRMKEETIRFLVGSFSDNLKGKFRIDEKGLWYNPRLEEEILKRNQFTESRRINGNKGGRPSNEKPKGKPKQNLKDMHMGNHMEDENEIEIEIENKDEVEVCPTFDDFWNEYDKKKGDKEKLKKKWKLLKQEEREKIMDYLPNYKFSTPDKQYRLNPETFLNNKSWNDEIINRNGYSKNKQSINNKPTGAAEVYKMFAGASNSDKA